MTDSTAQAAGEQAAGAVTADAIADGSAGVAEGQQQAAQATEDAQQAEGDKGEQKTEGAPDKYEFKAPEGSEFNPEVVAAFAEVAKELNLTQESAQKVVEKMAPVMAAKQAEQFEAAKLAWAETARADKEFGGDKLGENLAVAQKAMAQFGTPELRTLLNESGLGNHPEVIRVFYRAGKAISEDTFVTSGQGGAQADPAKRMFPSMN